MFNHGYDIFDLTSFHTCRNAECAIVFRGRRKGKGGSHKKHLADIPCRETEATRRRLAINSHVRVIHEKRAELYSISQQFARISPHFLPHNRRQRMRISMDFPTAFSRAGGEGILRSAFWNRGSDTTLPPVIIADTWRDVDILNNSTTQHSRARAFPSGPRRICYELSRATAALKRSCACVRGYGICMKGDILI